MAKLPYKTLSNKVCETPGCTRKIKQRLRDKENPNRYCYKCWQKLEAARNHFIDYRPRKSRVAAGLPVKNQHYNHESYEQAKGRAARTDK